MTSILLLESSITESECIEPCSNFRHRYTLFDKKQIVDNLYSFGHINHLYSVPLSDLIKLFIKEQKELGSDKLYDTYLISKWIREDWNGHYLDWTGCTSLSSKICDKKRNAQQIDNRLINFDPISGEFNRVAKSKINSNALGVFARTFIPAGTFLGYYRGEVMMPIDVMTRCMIHNYRFLFCANNEQFIDAHQILSCFARFYQYESKPVASANVFVRRIASCDPQSSVCFFTSNDVSEGEELLIPLGCESLTDDETYSPAFRLVNMHIHRIRVCV
jgi:hypothetical protein